MQMQMNRGFGGQPQPQRQGGRRGNRGGPGGFRGQTRFDNFRNQNQGQRPNEDSIQKPAAKLGDNQPQGQSPQNQARPNPQQGQNQQRPNQTNQNATPRPNQQQTNQPPRPTQQQPNQSPRPNQQPNQPQRPNQQPQQNQPPRPNPQPQQNQPPRPNQQPQQNQPPRANQQQQPNQQPQGPPPQQKPTQVQADDVKPKDPPAVKPDTKDNVDSAPIQQNFNSPRDHHSKNLNGGPNFGGNKQGGSWAQGGGPGNRFQRQGGPGGHGGQGGQGQGQGGPGGFGGPGRNQRPNNQGGRGGPHDGKPGGGPIREEQMLAMKLKDLTGPIIDLPPLDTAETKFNGRARLYIGNLTNDVTEEEIMTMFSAYGEASELFLNKEKNFGFIKMAYRENAERAKRELDGKPRNGKTLRVRFAPHNSAIRVKNLPPFVSNELLYRAFEIFGKIERSFVRVDERGKPVGEGVVEYVRKPSALAAIRNCTERCFFLTSSLRPVIVESYEEPDEFDGYPEKNLPKKHPEFMRAREVGPRFSEPTSFEHEYGTRWKQLHELHRQKEDALKKELAVEEEKLEAQMEYAKYEHETELLREQLRQRELDRERQKRSWEEATQAAELRLERERDMRHREGEQLEQRMRAQDDELRRRQHENTLFVQAQRLNSMLDRQEQGMFDSHQPQHMDGGFREQFDMGRGGGGGFDDMQKNRGWEGPRQVDDFPNKRRRF